jgi:hypothetical protein
MQETILTEKDKTCLHCGRVFNAERSTKKYCSDACKQTAFYQRNSMAGATMLQNSNEQEEDNTSVLFSQNNNPPLPLNGKDALAFNDKQTQTATVIAAAITLNDNNAIALPVATNASNNNRCNETNINHDAVKSNNKENPTVPIVTSSYINIPSTFIMAIAEQVDDVTSEAVLMNHYPDQYWQGCTLNSVTWANTRLRCLVENLLWLSKHLEIKRKVFMQLTEAFTVLVNSTRFKQLPENYPNRTITAELANQCSAIGEKYKKKKFFQLHITKQRKLQCIALRFMLAGTVPKIKFNELDFGE